MREVTERDFRMPQFRDEDPADYEFRDDGKIVRKDRWESGIQSIRSALGDNRRGFEIEEVVSAVKAMAATFERQPEPEREDGDED